MATLGDVTRRRSRGAPASCATSCGFCSAAATTDYVYFVEFRGRGMFLRASPIDVSAIVRELLLDRMHTTVLTSATLTVDGRFDYIRDRLGIGEADEIRLASEFDFAQQAILYLPPTHARSAIGQVRRRGEPRGDRDPQAHARPRVRPLHQLRDDARGAGDGGDGARLSDLRPGHRAALAAARTSFAPRRTRCSSPRRASGRGSTWSARR